MTVKIYGLKAEITGQKIQTKYSITRHLYAAALENGQAKPHEGNAVIAKLINMYGSENIEVIKHDEDNINDEILDF